MFLFDFLQEKWQMLLKNWASVEIYYKILKIWQKVFKIFAENQAYFQFLAGEISPPLPLIGNPAPDSSGEKMTVSQITEQYAAID